MRLVTLAIASLALVCRSDNLLSRIFDGVKKSIFLRVSFLYILENSYISIDIYRYIYHVTNINHIVVVAWYNKFKIILVVV